MTSVVPDSGRIKTFRTQAAFESWMRKNHARDRTEDVSVSGAPESLCARVSHHEHEDAGRTGEKNCCTGRDVGTRRNASPRTSL